MEIKSCPWCGGPGSLQIMSLGGPRGTGYPGHFVYYVKCTCCLCNAPDGKFYDIDGSPEDAIKKAIEKWNKRR